MIVEYLWAIHLFAIHLPKALRQQNRAMTKISGRALLSTDSQPILLLKFIDLPQDTFLFDASDPVVQDSVGPKAVTSPEAEGADSRKAVQPCSVGSPRERPFAGAHT